MSNSMVEIKNIVKEFDNHVAVKNVSIEVKQGEFLTLLGPSGCGKTTTLRMIAGFEQPTSGEIRINGENVEKLAPYERDVNTVFQSYALFPHMTVFENIAFGLKMKKTKKADIEQKVKDALKLVQLEQYGDRKPEQLSGGQKQRIAIARALVNNPKVLLLDEPLGALDLKLRKQMQLELKHLQQQLGITFVYVTHDQEEALTMSDRIAVMHDGILEQIGSPTDIYEKPKSRFVADFIGETNLFSGIVTSIEDSTAHTEIEGNTLPIKKIEGLQINDSISITLRPEMAWLDKVKAKQNKPFLEGQFIEHIYVGSVLKSVVKLPSGKEVTVSEPPNKALQAEAGETVYIHWEVEKAGVLREKL